jgi:hypothetical protein
MTEKCLDNLYVKPVEVCSFKALYELERIKPSTFNYNNNCNVNTLFSKLFKDANTNDLNNNFRSTATNEYEYKYDNVKKDLCHQLPNNSNNYRLNCVIATQSPFFTYNENKKTCSPIPSLELPNKFYYKYENANTYIYKIDDEESLKFNYLYKMQKAFCENKWYDWIITPNYHFGNQYEKDEGSYSKEDVRRCYKPCNKGYMPYTALNGSNICASKTEVLDGLYKNKLDYSPIALINLIGNNSNNLNRLYKLTEYIQLEKKYTTNDHYEINGLVKTDILTTEYKTNEIATLYTSMKDVVVNNILDENNFNIDNYEFNTRVLTYKNPNFNENDSELLTYRGMSAANMLSDEILFHTFFIAYKFEQHINTIISTIIKDLHNTDTPFNYDTTVKGSEYNIANNIIELFKDKILETNEKKISAYIQRIANIFYKAINVCYDNKTDFSKNIIIKTRIILNKFIANATDKAKIKEIYAPTLMDAQVTTLLTTLKDKENIIITFYDEKDFINITKISIPVPDKSSADTTKSRKDKEDATTLKNIDNRNIVLFTIEDSEKNNKTCKNNEIYNIQTGLCEKCSDVCTINTYKTNSRCNLFCKDEYAKHEKKNKNIISKCGVTKIEKIPSQNSNDIDTPLNENDFQFLQNIPYYLRKAVEIFFYAVILYLFYIFYQLYGETIFTIYNLITYYFMSFYYNIKNIRESNSYKADYEFDEYKKRNAIQKYERLVTKANSIKI